MNKYYPIQYIIIEQYYYKEKVVELITYLNAKQLFKILKSEKTT